MTNERTKFNRNIFVSNKSGQVGKHITTILFSLMLISGFYFGGKHLMELVITKIDSYMFMEKHLLSKIEEIDKLNQSLQVKEEELDKLKKVVQLQQKKYKEFNILLKELERSKSPKIALAIGFSESRLNKKAVHPTNDLYGIGGIKLQYWSKKLKIAKINPNSLQAIDYIYHDYIKQYKHKDIALKKYKGTNSNDYSFRLTKAYINKIECSKSFKIVMEAWELQNKLQQELGVV